MAAYEINHHLLNKQRKRYSPSHQTRWIGLNGDLGFAEKETHFCLDKLQMENFTPSVGHNMGEVKKTPYKLA